MERQVITVDIAPGNSQVERLGSSQGDIGRPMGVYVIQNGVALDCSAYSVELYILKPDGKFYTTQATVDATETNLIKWETALQETPVAGACAAQIRIAAGDEDIGTARFVEFVEAAPGDMGAASESEVALLTEYVRQARESATSAGSDATTASGAASSASGSASTATTAANTATQAASAATAAAERAEEVEESIPADYSQLSDDVTSLKSAFATIEKVYTLSDCDSSDIKYIKYNDGSLVTSGSWRTYFFKNDDKNAIEVSCTVAAVDTYEYAIAFYSGETPSSSNFISGVRIKSGTNSFSAQVPNNCKTIAICNRTASLDSPTGSVAKTLPIINRKDIDDLKERMLPDYEVGASGADYTQAVWITASDDSNNGKLNNGSSYETYFYKNIGYDNVNCELFLLTGEAAIAFYNSETPGADTCISTVPCSANGSKRTYTADVPNGCKMIAISNHVVALASPTIKLNISPETAQAMGVDAFFLSNKNEKQIQQIVGGSDDINYLNSGLKYIVQSSSAAYGVDYSKTQHDYFTVLHGSDFHKDNDNFKRMMEFAKANEGMIDCVLITGDLKLHWAESEDGWLLSYGAYYQDAGCPVLPVLGNHELGYSPAVESIGGVPNTIANIDAKFITPYMSPNGCVQGNSGGYYYRDFADYGIRVIALNEYEMPRIINPNENTKYLYDYWKRYLSQDQATWFVNTLNSVPENYSVIVIMHQMPDKINEYTENKFDSDIVIGTDAYDNAQGNIVQDIIDAYIDKTTLSHTYGNTISAPTTDVPDVTINADFTNANGEFIAYIVGHTHCDKIGESSQATNKQVSVVVTTSGTTKQQYDDLWRQTGTKSQDCFNMYVFDTKKKKIRILRIGANATMNMAWRDMDSVSYSQT